MSDRNDDYGRNSQGRRNDDREFRDPRDQGDYRNANRGNWSSEQGSGRRGERQDEYAGQRDNRHDNYNQGNEYGNYRGNDYPTRSSQGGGGQLGSDRDWQPRNPSRPFERNDWSLDTSGHDGPFGTGSQGFSTGYRSGENSRFGSSYTGFPGSESNSYSGAAGSYNQSAGQHAGKGPKGYQRSDERIREDVCDRLARHPHIDASEIEVKVSNGEVTLSGAVDERNAKRMSEDLAESVDGVREVHNQLRVQGQSQATNTGKEQPGKEQTTGHRANR